MIKLMDSGFPGAPGVAVLRPVEREVKQRLETVILLLQLMEEIHVQGMEVSLKIVPMIHVTKVKVKVSYLIPCPDCPNSLFFVFLHLLICTLVLYYDSGYTY